MLFGFCDAGECGGDEFRGAFGVDFCGMAGGNGEVINEFEDEEAGEGAAEVGDAGECISSLVGLRRGRVGHLRSK